MKRFATLLTFLFSVAIMLVLGEVVLRVKNSAMTSYDIEMWRYARELKVPSENPVLGHEHLAESEAALQSTDIRLNAWGLRGGPVAPREAVERRILFLGSSVTLGWGVPEEETLTERLQAMFNADGGPKTEVLNAGIGNYNTVRYVERFLTELSALEPTDIVVHYFVNDAEILEPGGGNFFLRHSQLAVTLWIALNRVLHRGNETGLITHYQQVYEPEADGFQAMQASLAQLRDYAAEKGVRVYLAMTPDVHNLEDYPYGYIHQIMAEIAERNGFVFVDVLSSFEGLTPEELWAMPGDPHPNSLGHEIMAEALYPVLKDADATGD
jgi:lysophospholipase L1-like esterase